MSGIKSSLGFFFFVDLYAVIFAIFLPMCTNGLFLLTRGSFASIKEEVKRKIREERNNESGWKSTFERGKHLGGARELAWGSRTLRACVCVPPWSL